MVAESYIQHKHIAGKSFIQGAMCKMSGYLHVSLKRVVHTKRLILQKETP